MPDEASYFLSLNTFEAHRASAALLSNNARAEVKVHNKAVGSLGPHNLDDYFTHGLRHQLRLEIPESPYITKSINDILRTGDVVTIEPGIYIEGWGGLRLEDDYLITEKGSQRLTDQLNQQFYLL